jgi:hypothetical protein
MGQDLGVAARLLRTLPLLRTRPRLHRPASALPAAQANPPWSRFFCVGSESEAYHLVQSSRSILAPAMLRCANCSRVSHIFRGARCGLRAYGRGLLQQANPDPHIRSRASP